MMVSASIVSAFAAAAVFSVATAQQASSVVSIPTPTVTLPANAMTAIGCFETSVPLIDHGSYLYQSPGNCQLICIMLNKPVMALSDGERCYCGDLIPPKKAQVDNSSCDTDCRGDDRNKCGGPSKYFVSLSGTTKNRIENFDPDKVSSSSTSTTQPPPTSAPPNTASATPTEQPKSSGPNKAGIAAGVVVGVVALAAIVGGVLYFLRQKKRRELEEEHRRQAAVNSFVSGGKGHSSAASMTDSRLDPDFMNRRYSNGSIADNEDYSRRILKVSPLHQNEMRVSAANSDIR
ncbi:uncharacterized protein EI97DRAFT_210298 [Westerdykella ornata]|uniref:WSC domain-containing protein n=1 Tax=Westerdykella ornata TaxID=318751 RepID=A0A6A6J7A1_WESOR|nr:uncharacterized protein EI97DRAFT_210298 [Westerdykella ornata]KAF2272451.1 hypothetical protein EI97DRAFT_210298 [Westerdykella ornata]